jgi:hypothetical protein
MKKKRKSNQRTPAKSRTKNPEKKRGEDAKHPLGFWWMRLDKPAWSRGVRLSI